jgi:hypothetical protein
MTKALALTILLRLGAPAPVAEQVATAVSMTTMTDAESRFLLAWGRHESNYLERIIENRCERWECDHGRARGGWQLHEKIAGRYWDLLPGSVAFQVAAAARATRWALRTCDGDARCSFRVLGGLHKDCPLRGEEERMQTYERVRRMQ